MAMYLQLQARMLQGYKWGRLPPQCWGRTDVDHVNMVSVTSAVGESSE